MPQYQDQPGDAVLFVNEKGNNDKAPDHRGFVIAHRDIKQGEKIGIALWARSGSSCTLKGKIQDMRSREKTNKEKTNDAAKPTPFDDEDEIPF